MIGKLRGKLIEKQAPVLMIELNNGLSYELEASMNSFCKLPELAQEVSLYTHQIVREDAHLLYGFYDYAERALFRLLIKANGVGPKLALTILSSFDPNQFVFCVQNNDSNSLVKIPGVGKKTAERLLIEMRDKLKDQVFESLGSANQSSTVMNTSAAAGTDANPNINDNNPAQLVRQALMEAQSALVSLGYKPQEASKMISQLDQQQLQEQQLSCEQIIKLALQGVLA